MLEKWGETSGSIRGCPQASENSREFFDPAPSKLFEPVKDARLKSLEDHAIRPLHLPIGVRVSD
jgi:hypothetical protein